MAAAATPAVSRSKKDGPSHPSYFAMAKDALITLAQPRGSSVLSIRKYISEKYDISADVVRVHLKPALAKGIENGTFIRPISSDAKGYTGRFKISKAKLAEEKKAAAAKLKEKREKMAAKQKSTKEASGSKSPKTKATAGTTTKTKVKSTGGIKKTAKKTLSPANRRKSSSTAKGVLKTPKQSKTAKKTGRKKHSAA